jgi:replicative DNA helicase
VERKILAAAIQDRESYEKLVAVVSKDDFSDLGYEIWNKINVYYDTDKDTKAIDIDLLKQMVEKVLPKHSEVVNHTLDILSETSVPNLLRELVAFKKETVARKLSSALRDDSREVPSLIEEYQNIEDTVSIDEVAIKNVSDYAGEILEELSDLTGLIKVYPVELNSRIDGGVMGGHQILIYARPNAGKTQFAINLSRGFIRDGKRVLYLCNEEPKKQILQRFISRLSGLQKRDVYKDTKAALKVARNSGLDNLYLEDINPGTFLEIERLIKKINPTVVVIDQLRNVKVKGDTRVNELEKAATEARRLAKKYNIVVVSITQAGDSAEGKLVLNMGDVDFSNTGIPAQMDLMVGVGVNDEYRANNMRMISIAKNKLSSDHSYFPVRVDESLSKFLSI